VEASQEEGLGILNVSAAMGLLVNSIEAERRGAIAERVKQGMLALEPELLATASATAEVKVAEEKANLLATGSFEVLGAEVAAHHEALKAEIAAELAAAKAAEKDARNRLRRREAEVFGRSGFGAKEI
jgi:hypothetical protein